MSDLIDRQALKDYVSSLSTNPLNEWDTWGVIAAIDKQPTVAAPRWHSAEEELPEDTKVVIIHKEWDGEVTLGYTFSVGGEMRMWMCLKTPYDLYEVPWVGAGHVDYWMPIPKPPKE